MRDLCLYIQCDIRTQEYSYEETLILMKKKFLLSPTSFFGI